MKLWVRVAMAVLLVAVLFGTSVHYKVAEPDHDPYPQEEKLATDYDAHIGEQALLFGTVQSVEDDRLLVQVESDAGPFEMTVSNATARVQPGGVVQVYGTLGPEQVIQPERTEVVNASSGSDTYKYGVSAAGALLVAILFVRYWTIDTDEWAFEVRADG